MNAAALDKKESETMEGELVIYGSVSKKTKGAWQGWQDGGIGLWFPE